MYCLRNKVDRVRHVGTETCLWMWLKIVVEEILRKRSPGGPRNRCEDNMLFRKQSESMDWIRLTQEGPSAECLGTNELRAFLTVFRVF